MIQCLLAAILLTGSPASAQEQQPFVIDVKDFCGIDDSLVSTKISPCHAQDASNVLTDNGRLEQIPGIEKIITSVLDGFPVKGVWPFTDSGGTEYLIIHASATIFQTNFSGDPVFLNNTDDTVTMAVVQAFGKIYFNNGTDTPWSWDGTSTAAVSGMPLCNHMEFANERIHCGNTATSNSEVAVSSFGGADFWTVPSDITNAPDAPNSFNFNKNDGDNVNCLKTTPYGIFVGKDNTTHILKGFDNDTYYKRLIAPDVGCVDDRLVQMLDGNVIWLAQQGVYAWPGAGPPILISKKIENRIKKIRQLTAQADSYSVNTNVEWGEGSSTSNGPRSSWDLVTLSARIFPSTSSRVETSSSDFSGGVFTNVEGSTGPISLSSSVVQDNFFDGDFTADPVWTVTAGSWDASNFDLRDGAGAATIETPSTISSGSWIFSYTPIPNPAQLNRCGTSAGGAGSCWTFKFIVDADGDYYGIRQVANGDGGADHAMQIIKDDGSETIFTSDRRTTFLTGIEHIFIVNRSTGGETHLFLDGVFISSTTDLDADIKESATIEIVTANASAPDNVNHIYDDIFAYRYEGEGIFRSSIFNTAFSTPLGGPFSSTFTSVLGESDVHFYIRSSTSANDDLWTSFIAASDTLRIGTTQQYWQYEGRFNTNIASKTAVIKVVVLNAVSTGIYTSAVEFIGEDITTNGVGDFTTTESPAGLLFFETRSATFSFSADNTNIGWTSHANHTTVQHSTGAYFQFRVNSSSMSSSSETAQVHRWIFNWQEGTSADGASMVLDRRYFMCVTIGSGSLENDSCEILQVNNEWTRLEGISVGAMTIYSNDPVAVDGSTNSAVWNIMQEDFTDFDGLTIDSFWVTKDFNLDHPNNDKTLHEIWIDADNESGSSIDVAYAINKSTTWVDSTIALDTNSDLVNEKVPIDAGFARGRYLRFRIRNNDLREKYNINNLTIYGDIEPRF